MSGDSVWREQVERKTGRPYPESYRPSGDVETVLTQILTRESDGGPDFPSPTTRTQSPPAVHGEHVAAGQLRVGAPLAGQDLAAVNHEWDREAWLRRVQRESR